jgi:glucosamine--fructose-6-phosphate aminotransferase (isomerizing)
LTKPPAPVAKGFGEPIAYEGALKIKEMSYLHAEGYSGGALKHGPFALIDDNNSGKFGPTPIIMLVLDDQHAHHMRTACEEVRLFDVPFGFFSLAQQF